MRKKSLLLTVAFYVLFSLALTVSIPSAVRVFADAPTYAYMPSDTALYAATSDGYEAKVYLPKTYFVTVLGTSGFYYRVGYGDITGYIRTSSVETVDYEPVTKFAYGSMSLKNGIASVFMYEDAALSRIIATVTATSIIDVYGYINSSYSSYYCRLKSDNVHFYGYLPVIGAEFIMPEENDVRAVELPPPDDSVPTVTTPENGTPNEATLQIILVVCLVIPAVIVVMLIFSGKSKTQS